MACAGVVKMFMSDMGYGWITPDDGGHWKTFFVHIKQCNGAERLSEGDILHSTRTGMTARGSTTLTIAQ